MGHTLEEFAAQCHDILAAENNPAGRTKVVNLLQEVLKDQEFVTKHLVDGAPERKVLYQDPEVGFAILGHVYEGARESGPHDHGPSWAIYGQAVGVTEMTEWEIVEPAGTDKAGKVRRAKTYPLKPGMAVLYNEGVVHSPKRDDSTRLIRIEGQNMDGVQRPHYEAIS